MYYYYLLTAMFQTQHACKFDDPVLKAHDKNRGSEKFSFYLPGEVAEHKQQQHSPVSLAGRST